MNATDHNRVDNIFISDEVIKHMVHEALLHLVRGHLENDYGLERNCIRKMKMPENKGKNDFVPVEFYRFSKAIIYLVMKSVDTKERMIYEEIARFEKEYMKSGKEGIADAFDDASSSQKRVKHVLEEKHINDKNNINNDIHSKKEEDTMMDTDSNAKMNNGGTHDPVVSSEMVREALNQLVRGDLYMDYGLEEMSLEKLLVSCSNSTSSSQEQGENLDEFSKFLCIITDRLLMNRKTKEGNKMLLKKERKKVWKLIQQDREYILAEIRNFANERKQVPCSPDHGVMSHDQDSSISSGMDSSKDHNVKDYSDDSSISNSDSYDSHDDSMSSSCSSSYSALSKGKRKKASIEEYKTKKGKRKKDNRRNHSGSPEETSAGSPRFLTADHETRRLLLLLPPDRRNRFRKQCFAKWHKMGYLPAIEISPLDVEPGPIRKQWIRMMSEHCKTGKPPTHLIFWYGTMWETMNEGFSFLTTKQLKPLEQGIKEGLEKVPHSIQKKMDSSKKLTNNEEFHLRALEQFHEDRARPPSERIPILQHYMECRSGLIE